LLACGGAQADQRLGGVAYLAGGRLGEEEFDDGLVGGQVTRTVQRAWLGGGMIAAAGTAQTDADAGPVAGLGAGGVVASPGLFARLQDRPG
jgi:hypothetical protein